MLCRFLGVKRTLFWRKLVLGFFIEKKKITKDCGEEREMDLFASRQEARVGRQRTSQNARSSGLRVS